MKNENKQCEIEIIKKKSIYHPDPTVVFQEICQKKKNTLLLESSEINTKKNLESMMIVDTSIRITAYGMKVKFESFTPNGKKILPIIDFFLSKKSEIFSSPNSRIYKFPEKKKYINEDEKLKSSSILDSIRCLLFQVIKNPTNSPKAIFLGGFFSYDLISIFEEIPSFLSKNNCPDFCFYLAEILLILDHKKKVCTIQSTRFNNSISEKIRLKNRISEIHLQLKKIKNKIPIKHKKNYQNLKNVVTNQSDSKFINTIKKIKKLICKGDIFQIVPSRKFFIKCKNPFLSYQILKHDNPSPYMFFMNDSKFSLFGASPESSLKFNPKNRIIELYPIAGTRRRGFNKNGKINWDLDSKIELEMRSNCKEIAEHIMLVDLARNDLARICEPGSRYVANLTKVDKYSHVMHLVSHVVGKLKKGLDALHAYQACMNMGTLSGAPKIKAMELISHFEGERRGTYGGAIGYLTASGFLDSCIIIRSAYVEKEMAIVQSGAGIVLDSIPQEEANESRNKAQVVLNSIFLSNQKHKI
ncbi:anthranilate synthase component 1 (plasmid) [Buchnera aphidicola (Kurisakia onigurumii)]|uniref:anthranilate synthase component 1 n=1 Tax=Buchnera aphidicola TaxID=9 RepID=UPI0031B6CC83